MLVKTFIVFQSNEDFNQMEQLILNVDYQPKTTSDRD
jgi:hypothetical protein